MKRAFTLIFSLLVSIHSSIVAWPEDHDDPRDRMHSVQPHFGIHAHDEDSPIIQFGIRSVVYEQYGFHIPPPSPPSAPKPAQKIPQDIINNPRNCADWSVDDFYNAIQLLFTEKTVAKTNDSLELLTSANSVGTRADYYMIYGDAKNYRYVSHVKLTSLMASWELFEYDNFWAAIHKLPYHPYITLNTQAFINGNQAIKDAMTFNAQKRLKEEVKKDWEHFTLIRDHRRKKQEKEITERTAFYERVAKSFDESFEELHNEKDEWSACAQWIEEHGAGDAQRIYDRIAAI